MKSKNPKKMTLAEQIEALKERAESKLTRLSEECRPSNVPAPWMRLNWLARANGNIFEACLFAIREGQ